MTAGRLSLLLIVAALVAGRVFDASSLAGVLFVAAIVVGLVALGGSMGDRDYRDPGPSG
jgi:hypothetical protein